MKKICIVVALLVAAFSMQAKDNNVLRHLSLSVGVGSTGITGDVGTMVTNSFGLRAGVDYTPEIKADTWLDLDAFSPQVEQLAEQYNVSISDLRNQFGFPEKIQVEGTYNSFTSHALVDIYPFSDKGFRFTVGAYFGMGGKKLISAFNKEDGVLKGVADFNARRGAFANVPAEYGQIAAKLGEYNVMPDDQGNADAYMQVKKVRPYVGLGFGRAVPKSSINCQFDLGVQFWGHPEVYDGVSGKQLTTEGTKGADGGLLKIISDVSVFPVLTLRLCGRIF